MDLFWERVDKSAGPDACWPWIAGRDSKNYGHVWQDGTTRKAHRVALELATGWTGDMAIHSCDNPPCCNPAHLRWGDNAANVADMVARDRMPAQMRPRTFCRSGRHALTDDNVVTYGGERRCRTCLRDRLRAEDRSPLVANGNGELRPPVTSALSGSPVVISPRGRSG